MSGVFIVLALVSGFIYTNQHAPARYLQKRATGWDSYFYVATRGALIGLLSAFTCIIIDYFDFVSLLVSRWDFHYKDMAALSVSMNDIKMGAWGVVTILTSYFIGCTSKLYYFFYPDRKDRSLAKAISCDHLDSFWVRATIEMKPVLITLKTRKCYVGLPLSDVSAIEDGGDYISVLPLLSGYRDKDDLSLSITTNYFIHYKEQGINEKSKVNLSHFKTIIPKSEIECVSFFDLDTFKAFKQKEEFTKLYGSNSIGEPIHADSYKVS